MTDEVDRLMAGIAERKVRDLARAITVVENGGPDGLELLRRLAEQARSGADRPRSHVVGITGSPGVGKSTMTAALITAFRARGQSVAVVAVDPSSPFSGGALLGDRIRMQSHSSDENVFIRSMASRGHLGGLAAAAGHVLRVLDAAGFDIVVMETVGVGQSEVEVAAAADTTIVMLAPGMGDGIQAAKAGILEIGDLFVVNKADRQGAQTTARELRQMISLESTTSWLRSLIIVRGRSITVNSIAGALPVLARRSLRPLWEWCARVSKQLPRWQPSRIRSARLPTGRRMCTGQPRRWSTRWGQAQGHEYVAQGRVVSPSRKPGFEAQVRAGRTQALN